MTGQAGRRGNASTTVLRAMALLDVLAAEPRGLRLSEASRRAKLDKATTFRLLNSLQGAGVAVRDAASGLYRPGLKLVGMAERLLQSLDFRTVSHPHVEALAGDVGHSVLAGVLDGAEVVYVDHVAGSNGLRVHRQLGGRRSVHVSAIGKAILAHLPPVEARGRLELCRLEPRTPSTIVDRDAFLAQLETVRGQGWALVRDEDTVGASSVAAPVFDYADRVVGAIGVTGPSFLLEGAALDRAVRLLLQACCAASADLGHAGAAPAGASDERSSPTETAAPCA